MSMEETTYFITTPEQFLNTVLKQLGRISETYCAGVLKGMEVKGFVCLCVGEGRGGGC